VEQALSRLARNSRSRTYRIWYALGTGITVLALRPHPGRGLLPLASRIVTCTNATTAPPRQWPSRDSCPADFEKSSDLRGELHPQCDEGASHKCNVGLVAKHSMIRTPDSLARRSDKTISAPRPGLARDRAQAATRDEFRQRLCAEAHELWNTVVDADYVRKTATINSW